MNDSAAPLVELQNIHKWFGDLHVLKGIDISMNPKQVVVVIGPSGSGKSTLLRCINVLEMPTQGKVIFDGEDITEFEPTSTRFVRTSASFFRPTTCSPTRT